MRSCSARVHKMHSSNSRIYIKCTRAALACTYALVQHAMNMRVLLQIYRGMYERARLTANLHVSCTVSILGHSTIVLSSIEIVLRLITPILLLAIPQRLQ